MVQKPRTLNTGSLIETKQAKNTDCCGKTWGVGKADLNP